MSLLPREAQNLLHSRFSSLLIPFSMFSLDYDDGKVKYSPLYGRGSKVTILVGRHFQSEMLPMERASKKTYLGHIFVRNWRPTQKCSFWCATLPPSGAVLSVCSHGRHKTYSIVGFLTC